MNDMMNVTMDELLFLEPLQRRSVLGDISIFMRGSPSHGNLSYLHELYPPPSPEEQIIRQRSSRRTSLPLSKSQQLEYDTGFLQLTPSKDTKFSQLSRKRLLMSPPKTSTPKKQCLESSDVSSLDLTQTPKSTPEKSLRKHLAIQSDLQAYNTSQLVNALDTLVNNHPELEQEIRTSLKAPDLVPLKEKLICLKHNVYRSLPTRRYGSSRDAYSFRRAKVHLTAFKKWVVDEGKVMVLCQSWETVIRYVMMTWPIVRTLPDWELGTHNQIKAQCFQSLAAQCMVALRRGHFNSQTCRDMRKRLLAVAGTSKELEPCIQHIDKLLQSML